MPRPRKYKSNAERQAAYRKRRKAEQVKLEAHREAVVKPLERQIIFGNEAGELSDFRGPDPK